MKIKSVLALLLALSFVLSLCSCDQLGMSENDGYDYDNDGEIDENLLPDGTYKIVFWEGEDPVKVTFKGGKPEDPSLFYREGMECVELYPSKQMMTKRDPLYARQNGTMHFLCIDGRGLDRLLKPGDKLWAWWDVREIYVDYVVEGKRNTYGFRQFFGDPIQCYAPDVSDAVFDGWFNEDYTVRYSDRDGWIFGYELITDQAYSIVDGTITLYGRYISKYLDVTLDYGDGKTDTLRVERGQQINDPKMEPQVEETRILTHWSLTPGGEPFEGTVNDNLHLYAVYTGYKTTMLHDGFGNSVQAYMLETGELIYDQESPFGHPGFSVAAWYTDSALTSAPITALSYQNLQPNYYAKWERAVYTVNFAGNAELEATPPLTYSMGDLLVLPTLVADGYYFAGWSMNEALSGTPILNITPEMYGDLTLYPVFYARAYQITLTDRDGIFYNKTVSVTYGESYELPTVDVEGRRFMGWMNENGVMMTDADGKSLKPYDLTCSTAFYAKFA